MQYRIVTSFLLGVLFFGLPIGSEAQIRASPALGKQSPNGFDLSNSAIPTSEIRAGGPGRDGIPAIDHPKFLPAKRADFLRDDDVVISFTAGGATRAYPLRILVWHEIVNDEFGGQAIAVTYCPLCGTAMVFDRRIGGRTLNFGVSGLLYQSDVLLYDRQTESLWSQLEMNSVSGPLAGTELAWLPSEHLTWSAWRQKYPQGKVLSTNTGHARNYSRTPYAEYNQSPETMVPVPQYRTELPKKAWVIGLIVAGESRAYPVTALPPNQTVSDFVGGQEVHVTFDPGTSQPTVVRADTGERVPFVMVFWFAWQAFYPETSLWTP